MQNEGVVANNEEVAFQSSQLHSAPESNEKTKEYDETESNDISKMWKKIEFNRSILQQLALKVDGEIEESNRKIEIISNDLKKFEEMERHMEFIMNQVKNVKDDLSQLKLNKSRYQNENTELYRQAPDNTNKYEAMQTSYDTEKRKKNLVIYNIWESQDNEIENKIKYDLDVCYEIFGFLGAENIEIMKIDRIGPKKLGVNQQLRPILVKLRYEEEKWNILGRSKNLRNSEYDKVYINKDMSKEEREEDARLRKELNEMRGEGIQCTIKNGQIIRRRKDPILRDYLPDQPRRNPRNMMEISRSST